MNSLNRSRVPLKHIRFQHNINFEKITHLPINQVMWLTFCTALVGFMPEGENKRWMVQKVSVQCFGVLSSALSAVINYHNIENRPSGSGICVANHTSPIDVLVLMCDYCYSLVSKLTKFISL